jgi:hypothetical protein
MARKIILLFSLTLLFLGLNLAFRNALTHPEERKQSNWTGELTGEISLKKNWYLQSSFIARQSGEKISSPGFRPRGWVKTEVPTTVLAALVRRGIYPEPTLGLNNMKIPDAHEDYSRKYGLDRFSHLAGKTNPWRDPYWFWTQFKVPPSFQGKHIWLELKGINYRAEIWLNGQLVANHQKVVGMFGHWSFDISRQVRFGKKNSLAIKIYPLDNPGLPASPQLQTFGPFGENGGPTGDIGQNVTMQCSIGWDWIPEVRDRNIGLWQPVMLKATGPVEIRYPVVSSRLIFPEGWPGEQGVKGERAREKAGAESALKAALTIRAELHHLEKSRIKGRLKAKIMPYNFSPSDNLLLNNSFPENALVDKKLTPFAFPSGYPFRQPDNQVQSHSGLDPGFFLNKSFSDTKQTRQKSSAEERKSLSGEIYLEKEMELGPLEVREIILDQTEWPQLLLSGPRLWWPADMGFPHLYLLEMTFEISGSVSDREMIRFGIREIKTQTTETNGWRRRDFFLNGQKIFLRGGAWVPEMLLRREANQDWLLKELLLWRQANLNLVRLWGGGVTPGDEFFDLCDELGLLIWHDFWITGDCQGTWGKGSRDWPLEAHVFLDNARQTVLRLRSHPSLLLWTAGNEGYPRREIYEALRNEILARLDGTRPFLPSSGYTEPPPDWGLSWPDNQPSGTYSGGPYWWVNPEEYYNLIDRGRDWLFKNEVGLPSLPLLSSLKKFLVDLEPAPDLPFPLNHIWGFHDACEGNGKYSLYDQAIRQRYGQPRSLADYVWKAQLVNAENYRAIFEAANQALDRVSGVILWKTNSAWPSVMWQLYDYYLRPNASYYFVRRCGELLHPQLDLRDKTVWLINRSLNREKDLLLQAEIYDIRGQKRWAREEKMEIEGRSRVKLWPIEFSGPSFCLLRLDRLKQDSSASHSARQTDQISQIASGQRLKNKGQSDSIQPLRKNSTERSGRLSFSRSDASFLLAENFYWLSPQNEFTFLEHLPPVQLEAEMEEMAPDSVSSLSFLPSARLMWQVWKVQIHNPSDQVAFFVHLSLFNSKEEILPCFWEDNFFLLLPHESKEIHVATLTSTTGKRKIYGFLEGYNVLPSKIKLKRPKS